MQFIVIACIFFGELLVIYSEQIGAKMYGVGTSTFLHAFGAAFVPAVIGAALLVIGYMLGVKFHQNVWAVTAVSLGSILIVEPAFNYFYLGHLPDMSETIGVLLGIAGIISVTFF